MRLRKTQGIKTEKRNVDFVLTFLFKSYKIKTKFAVLTEVNYVFL